MQVFVDFDGLPSSSLLQVVPPSKVPCLTVKVFASGTRFVVVLSAYRSTAISCSDTMESVVCRLYMYAYRSLKQPFLLRRAGTLLCRRLCQNLQRKIGSFKRHSNHVLSRLILLFVLYAYAPMPDSSGVSIGNTHAVACCCWKCHKVKDGLNNRSAPTTTTTTPASLLIYRLIVQKNYY